MKSPDVVGTIAIATDTASSKMLNTMSKVVFLFISNQRPKNRGDKLKVVPVPTTVDLTLASNALKY